MPNASESQIRISLTADRLRATLVYAPAEHADPPDTLLVHACVEERGVKVDRAVEAAITRTVERIAETPGEAFETVIAQGVRPVHGKDGTFHLVEHLAEAKRLGDHKKQRYAELDEGAAGKRTSIDTDGEQDLSALDHYERSTLLVVRANDRIGTITPPTEGEDGIDVCGTVIPAVKGRAYDIDHDRAIDVLDSGEVIARRSGLLNIEGTRFRIQSALEILGSVDFSTGNVNFPGSVRIADTVKDRFSVEADKDIEVGDVVEGAQVIAGRDALLRRGMSGRGKGYVRTGRDLVARTLDQAEADVGRTLRIEREIKSCDIRVQGSVEGPQAWLLGGTLAAGGSIELGTIGSPANTETQIGVGRIPSLLNRALQAIEILNAARDATERTRPLMDRLKATPKLNPEEAERLTLLSMEQAQRDNIQRLANDALTAVARTLAELTDPTLNVLGKVFPGTEVLIGRSRVVFKSTVSGPLTITLDAKGRPALTLAGEDEPLLRYAEVTDDPTAPDLSEWAPAGDADRQAA